jgi:hypothetical protein
MARFDVKQEIGKKKGDRCAAATGRCESLPKMLASNPALVLHFN